MFIKSVSFVTGLSSPTRLLANFIYDSSRFLKSSSAGGRFNTKTKFQALIIKEYHRIEKGLALKEPRVGFGYNVVQSLVLTLRKYQRKYGLDETAQTALNVLFAYYEFNLKNGRQDEQLYKELVELKNTIPHNQSLTSTGGVLELSKQEILDSAQLDLRDFFKSRYSIRQFTSENVEMSLIEAAVKMAQKTPSVCNRQSSKVYVFSSDEDKRKALSYQMGNRGFGDQASKVLIVTSNLGHFFNIGERNQCWIDGGMFAMSLVYALLSLGLGTCCLNWSVVYERDLALKKAVRIDDSESIIMMIAVGHLPDELKVAQSARKTLKEVLIVR